MGVSLGISMIYLNIVYFAVCVTVVLCKWIVHLKITSYYLNEGAMTDLEIKRESEFKNSSKKARCWAVSLVIISSSSLRHNDHEFKTSLICRSGET